MSDALSGIIGSLSGPTGQNIGKLASGGMGLVGLIGQIMQSRQAAQRQKFLDDLAKNPAKLAALIKGAQQPLSQGLVQDVTNQTQAQLAERGLSSSPQIAASVESQALAPFALRSQEDAQSAFMNALGLDVGGPSALPSGSTDTSSFWRLFQPPSSSSLFEGSTANASGISDYSSFLNLPSPGAMS